MISVRCFKCVRNHRILTDSVYLHWYLPLRLPWPDTQPPGVGLHRYQNAVEVYQSQSHGAICGVRAESTSGLRFEKYLGDVSAFQFVRMHSGTSNRVGRSYEGGKVHWSKLRGHIGFADSKWTAPQKSGQEASTQETPCMGRCVLYGDGICTLRCTCLCFGQLLGHENQRERSTRPKIMPQKRRSSMEMLRRSY